MKRTALWMGIVGLVVVVSAFCVFKPSGADGAEEHDIFALDQSVYARQVDVAFEGGRACVGLFDEEAAMEFAERQPLSIQLERRADRIVVVGVPDGVFCRNHAGIEALAIGDIVMDVRAKEVFICCRNMDASDGRILLGHVVSGIEPLSRMEGTFEAFAMAAESL